MIDARLDEINGRIRNACANVGRNPDEVKLVLVTKEVGVESVEEAYRLGQRDFGENRVQEFIRKRESLPADIRWHLIGHLQTNKVKSVVGQVHLIHSLDRLDLAKEIEKQAAKLGQVESVLIQVNTSGEETKFGLEPAKTEAVVREMILSCPSLNFCGLMTIGPNARDERLIRQSFSTLRALRDRFRQVFAPFDWRWLSMGMTSDYEIAVEEGANLLRIGTAVFGERPKNNGNH